jgi:hypothetical protein
MSTDKYEEMSCWYVQQVGAALHQMAGERGEWAAARVREKVARSVLAQAGARFAPITGIRGLGHFAAVIRGDAALAAGFVLHAADGLLRGSGLEAADIVDDGVPQIPVDCVGVLKDGRAVRFWAILSVAQAIGATPPDDDAMAAAVARQALDGELEWWVQ